MKVLTIRYNVSHKKMITNLFFLVCTIMYFKVFFDYEFKPKERYKKIVVLLEKKKVLVPM